MEFSKDELQALCLLFESTCIGKYGIENAAANVLIGKVVTYDSVQQRIPFVEGLLKKVTEYRLQNTKTLKQYIDFLTENGLNPSDFISNYQKHVDLLTKQGINTGDSISNYLSAHGHLTDDYSKEIQAIKILKNID